MTEKFFIEPLFSNFIASDILDVDCDKIVEYIKTVEPGLPLNLNEPAIHDVIDEVHNSIPEFMKIYGLGLQSRPRVTTCWANRNNASEPLKPHLHGTHWISAVFYPEADEESPDLVLKNPITNVMEYAVPYQYHEHATLYNSGRIKISPKKGLLVYFPSWIEHWVDPECPSTSNRYSLAFNITLNHISKEYIDHIYHPNNQLGEMFSIVNKERDRTPYK